jgi:hypothetical protein
MNEVAHEHTDDKSRIQHSGVLDCRKTLCVSETPRATGSNGTPANFLATFAETSGTDVSCAGATYPGLASEFAYPAALGDLLAAVLALVALWAVVKNWRSARFLVWVFALEGTIDLINAITLAQLHGAAAFMGAAYWIPAFWVPALLVTLYITFVVLIKHWKDAGR